MLSSQRLPRPMQSSFPSNSHLIHCRLSPVNHSSLELEQKRDMPIFSPTVGSSTGLSFLTHLFNVDGSSNPSSISSFTSPHSLSNFYLRYSGTKPALHTSKVSLSSGAKTESPTEAAGEVTGNSSSSTDAIRQARVSFSMFLNLFIHALTWLNVCCIWSFACNLCLVCGVVDSLLIW